RLSRRLIRRSPGTRHMRIGCDAPVVAAGGANKRSGVKGAIGERTKRPPFPPRLLQLHMRRGPLCDKQPHAAADPGTATSTVADESPQATTSTVSFESLQLCGRIDVFSA